MRPARVSTIVWGVILLLVAGTAFAITTLDLEVTSGTSIAYLVVGLGALLVVAAIIGAVARAVKPAVASPVEPVSPVEPAETAAEPVSASSTSARTSAKTRTKDQPVD